MLSPLFNNIFIVKISPPQYSPSKKPFNHAERLFSYLLSVKVLTCSFKIPPSVFNPFSPQIYLQPPRNTQPRLLGYQNLMFQFAAFEKDAFATFRWNGLLVVGVLDAQFAAVFLPPIVVEVYNHAESSKQIMIKKKSCILPKKQLFLISFNLKFFYPKNVHAWSQTP